MVLRWMVVLLLSMSFGLAISSPARADDTPAGTRSDLPGTTLEAEARDDGTSPAPWLIGSAAAATVAVVVGGSVLKRRMG